MNGRERVLGLLAGHRVDRTPVMPITMMFAARQIGATYGDYARDHRVLGEAQIRTSERFDFDYVSVISDPARETADLGGSVRFFDDQPPAIDEDAPLLADKSALRNLRVTAGARMHDRIDGVALLRQRVGNEKLVEGWVEGPCALGADFRGINTLMLDFFDDEPFVRELFAFCVEFETQFAKEQIAAGADIIGIGDAAASLVGPEIYREFVWPMEKRLVEAVHHAGTRVRLHICGNTRSILKEMGELGCDLVDLDYFSPVAEARAAMGPKRVLSGNINPVSVLRDSSAEAVRDAIRACQSAAEPNYIIAAGCEVPRDTRAENVQALRNCSVSRRS